MSNANRFKPPQRHEKRLTVIYNKIEPNGKQQTNKQNRQAKAIKTKSWLGQSMDKIEYNDSEEFCFGALRGNSSF